MTDCNQIFVLHMKGKTAPVSVPIENKSVCPYCEINRLKDRIAELEQALDELGVTPAEAKAGVARSRAKTARIAELERALDRIAICLDTTDSFTDLANCASEALGRV